MNTMLRYLLAAAIIGIRSVATDLPASIDYRARYLDDSGTSIPIPGYNEPPPPIGKNVDGGDVSTNFSNAYYQKQIFFLVMGTFLYEQPASKAKPVAGLLWCSDLTFTNFQDGKQDMGYVGKCVHGVVSNEEASAFVNGQTLPAAEPTSFLNKFLDGGGAAQMISSVFSYSSNAFDTLMHTNTGTYRVRFLDDGQSSCPGMPMVHGQNDNHTPEELSSFAGVSRFNFITPDDAAAILHIDDPSDLNSEAFDGVYEQVWNANHNDNVNMGSTKSSKSSKGKGRKEERNRFD